VGTATFADVTGCDVLTRLVCVGIEACKGSQLLVTGKTIQRTDLGQKERDGNLSEARYADQEIVGFRILIINGLTESIAKG